VEDAVVGPDVVDDAKGADRRPAAIQAVVTAYRGVLRPIHAVGWRRIRIVGGLLFFAWLVKTIVLVGVPTGREELAAIIIVGLAISSLGRGWRRLSQVVIDWLPFTLILMAYDQTRGVAASVGMHVHVRDIVDAEKWLFDGTIPTVWLQQHLYNPHHVYWYDALCTLIYTSHFLATPILAAILWLRDRALWVRFASRVIVLAILGLITYILFPEAPPWLASKDGVIPQHVARLSARGWIWLHASHVNKLLAHAQKAGSNPVAAMPSLHVAFASMVALFIASRIRSRWRYLLVLYPIGMGFTLVYTGEHYVLDLIFGLLYALVVHLSLKRWERTRVARRERRAAQGPAVAADKPEDLQPAPAR
jgi:membrane-associated phospholipid phosphatase